MKRLSTILAIWLSLLGSASAQNVFTMPPPAGIMVGGFQVVASCGAASLTANQLAVGVMDVSGKFCVNATVSATITFPTFGAAFPATGIAFGFLQGGNLVAATGTLGNLNVNCQVGCSGGSFNNNAEGVATSATNGQAAAWGYFFNGTTWDRARGDTTNGIWANIKTSVLPTGAATSANQATEITSLGTIATNSGTQATAANQTTGNTSAAASAAALGTTTDAVATAPASTSAATITSLLKALLNTGQYPSGATAITASATGTTGATTATLAGAVGKTTYICGMSIRANATAAVTGNATVTGTITGTLNFTQWTAPTASGLGVTEQIFNPCVPASATNTGIAIVSAAPGTGGVVSSTGWGYQL